MKAIVNGKIMTMAGEIIEKGTVLIEGGIVKAIGEYIEVPTKAKIIDASSKVVFPGMIDAHTHLGIGEDGLGWEGRDYNEMTGPLTPHLRAIDAINPFEEGILNARINGITTVMTGPGSANVIGGESLAMKTNGTVVDDMIIKNPVGIKAAFGENPKRVYNEKGKMPTTRMGVAAVIREALMQAEDYLAEKENKLAK